MALQGRHDPPPEVPSPGQRQLSQCRGQRWQRVPWSTCFLRNRLTQRNQVSYSKITQQKEGKNLGQGSFSAAPALRSKLAEAPDRQCLQIRWVTLKPWSGATKEQDQTLCKFCSTVCFTRRPWSVLPAPRKQGAGV